MITSTQAIAASRLHAADYTLIDASWLRCRHCSRRVEPPMSRVHLGSAHCRIARGRAVVAKLGLVRVDPRMVPDLDRAGLLRWLTTDLDEDGGVLLEPWATSVLLRYVRNRSTATMRRVETRRPHLMALGELTPRELEAVLTGAEA